MAANPAIVELTPEQTHPIRRAVLRDGTASDAVEFDGDHAPGTFHLGVVVDGGLVAISSWMERRYPDLPGHAGHQLRGMATLAERRGDGLGARMLEAGLERASVAGSTVVWARARSTALAFYERHGFERRGDQYTDLTTGLAHHDIVVFV
ncbi:MAG: GNAT family N-acetyltransferase [Ilumatobacteraceae bacterium]